MLKQIINKFRIIICALVTVILSGQQVTKNFNSFNDWQNSEFKGLQVNAQGALSLAPSSRRIIQVPEGIIWAYLPDGLGGGYVSAGNEGRIFRLSGGQLKPFVQMKGGIVFAMARLGEDLIVAPSGQGRLVRINSLGESSTFAQIDARIVWHLEAEGREILTLGGGERGAVLISAREGSSRKLAEMTEEITFTAFARDTRGAYLLGTHGNGLVVKYNRSTDRLETLFDTGMDEVRNLVVSGNRVFASANRERPSRPNPPVEVQIVTPKDIYFPSEPGEKTKSILFEYNLDSKLSRTLWQSQQSFAFALATWKNRLLLGTGDRSRIFSFDLQDMASLEPPFALIQELNCAQATAFVPQGSEIYAIGSNPGEIYSISDNSSTEGYLESEILSSSGLTRWGRAYLTSDAPAGTSVSIQFRSGQTRWPDATWTSWSPLLKSGERPGVPLSKFAQFRIKMTSSVGGVSPEVREVKLFWALENLKTQVKSIEVLPPGIFVTSNHTNPTITPLRPSEILAFLADGNDEELDFSENFRLGIQGFVFNYQTEAIGRQLFRITLRDEKGMATLLEESLNSPLYAFDTNSYEEGAYRLEVVSANSWQTAESSQPNIILSPVFIIDREPPKVDKLTLETKDQTLQARFLLSDLRSIVSHCFISFDGQQWQAVRPDDGIYDQASEEFILRLNLPSLASPRFFIRTMDDHANESITNYAIPIDKK